MTKKTKPDNFGRLPGDPNYGEDAVDVLVNGDRLGGLDETLKWLNRFVVGRNPPAGLPFVRFMGSNQPAPGKATSAPAVGQMALKPDNWENVGMFVRHDPSDFGAKGTPYWVHLRPPKGAKEGGKTAWQAGGVTHKETGWPSTPARDRAGRATGDPNYGADPEPFRGGDGGSFRGKGASGSW